MINETPNSNYEPNKDLDLIDFIRVIWAGKISVIIISIIFAISSVGIALIIPDKYQSSAVLYEVKNGSGTSSGLLANLGGLASIAGINLPSSAQDKTILAIKTLRSRSFLKNIINYPGVLEGVMAVDYYDKKTKKLYYKSDMYDEKSGKWLKNEKFSGANFSPSYLDVYDKKINDVIGLNHNKKDNYLIVSVEHESPIFAEYLLSIIISDLDNEIKKRDIAESENAIKYLEQKLRENSLKEINSNLNKLVEENLKTLMLANVQKEYLLRVLDPPFIPERRSTPNRVMICIIGTFLGFFVGIMFVLIRKYIPYKRYK